MSGTAAVSPEAIRPVKLEELAGGALTLALLLLVQFLDFLDVSIVNVALPSIQHDLGFSEQSLQWSSAATCSPTAASCCSAAAPPTSLGRRRILVGGLDPVRGLPRSSAAPPKRRRARRRPRSPKESAPR